MLKHFSNHHYFRTTWRAVIVGACLIAFVVVSCALAIRHSQAAQGQSPINNLWQDVGESSIPAGGARQIIPSAYRTLRLDLAALKTLLASAPMEFTQGAKEAPLELAMPMPDGKSSRFRIVESPMMEPELAAKFPEIKNYSGHGLDDPTASLRCDLTPAGFHAFILSTGGTVLVAPYAKDDTAHYISYYLRDDPRERAFNCFVKETGAKLRRPADAAPQIDNGGTLHTYRLAVAATGEFTVQNGGTVASAMAAINTTIMAVNAIYAVEVSVRLSLINNENAIIYTDVTSTVGSPTRPYTTQNINNLILENQSNLDNVIGNGSYDIGQVFDSSNATGGAAGLAALNAVCDSSKKGKGTSGGNSVILAAHEMGHQFGATHTFNDSVNGSCGSFNGTNQRTAESAYEPGSGSTIMSYGGTCGAADLQQVRDTYFHIRSLEQIVAYTTGDGGASGCDVETATGNVGGIVMTNYSPEVTVPSRTPFMLSVQAIDLSSPPDATTITWEEYDLGLASPPEIDFGNRPLFRSKLPAASGDRMFPAMQYILNNDNIPPPTYQCGVDAMGNPINCLTGESRTLTTRTMNFVATARDNVNAIHSVPVQVHVVDSGAPFAITNLNAPNITWAQGTRQTIVWNTANTASAPFNVANVRISLVNSITFTGPIILSESVPNTGSAIILVPQIEANNIRVKIDAIIDGNFNSFFDVSNTDITIRPIGVYNTNNSGDGSLRQAIDDANSDPGLTKIPFSISGAGVQVINLTAELPLITTPVILDGLNQGGEGYIGPPLIELNGAGAGATTNGLTISAGNCTVNGLAINRFSLSGIDLRTNGGNVIEGCYIGTNAAGTAVLGNGGSGVLINNTPNNRLGSPTTLGQFRRNIIAGNNVGVTISGSAASGNSLYYNYIGTNVDGARLSNTADGVRITGAPNNIIGGTRALTGGIIFVGTGNVISGNNSDGIEITGSAATGNVIQANFIGLKPDGATALNNFISGIRLEGAPNNQIGGTGAAAGNTISGNSNSGGIVLIGGSSGTLIQGNYLGISADGTAAVANNSTDIYIESANNLIGGTAAGARNVISGSGAGVFLSFAGATGNVIQGNYIGTDATGTVALNVNGEGIGVRGANNNLIGGTTPAARNIISGNGAGIHAVGGTTNLLIQGNYIGTNPAGTAVVGNRFQGVFIEGSSSNTVGGTTPGAGNVISGNGGSGGFNGVALNSASGNTIQGNLIGTNAAGTAALGNNGNGIVLAGPEPSNNNIIGGTTAAARNVISANTGDGILITGFGNGNTVQGNFIGTDAGSTMNLGNGFSGVEIASGDNNVIGGTGAGAGNLIAFSGAVSALLGDGVRVAGGITDGVLHGIGNRIRGNAIFSNVRRGIELLGGTEATTGVTANDACDADTGANNLQNYPVLNSAISSGMSITLVGALNSTANTTFSLDFYASTSCDSSGNGEGQTYLGSTLVTTDATCNGAFNVAFAAAVPAGRSITATATNPAGNTSEYSACLPVTCGFALTPTSQFFLDNGGDGSINLSAGGSACSWSVTVSDPWVFLTSSESGSGSDIITFEVRENMTRSARQTTVNVGGQSFKVIQDGGLGEDCQYSLQPAFTSVSGGGGSGTVQVIADERCAWHAVADVNWITINGDSAGIGNGQVSYTVGANPGAGGRKGTIVIAGQSFTIKQKGS